MHADAKFGVFAVEDVGAVPRAVHPRRHDRRRCGLTARDVFRAEIVDPGRAGAIPGITTIRVGVREEPTRGHVGAVVTGKPSESGVVGNWATPGRGPLRIDDVEHLGFSRVFP